MHQGAKINADLAIVPYISATPSHLFESFWVALSLCNYSRSYIISGMSIDLLRADEVEQSIWSDTCRGKGGASQGCTLGLFDWGSRGLHHWRFSEEGGGGNSHSLTLNQQHLIKTTRPHSHEHPRKYCSGLVCVLFMIQAFILYFLMYYLQL